MRVGLITALAAVLLVLNACGGASIGPDLNSIDDLQNALQGDQGTSRPSGSGGTSINLPGETPQSHAASIQNMLQRHNSTRSELGLGTLTMNSRLTTAAQQQAQYCASVGKLTHTGANGSSVGTRATAAGYVWYTVGENLAYSSNPNNIYELWLGSSGHYRNITNPAYTNIGIARVASGGREYWCAVFGRPQ